MKKYIMVCTLILVIAALGTCFTGCSQLTPSEGIAELSSAYANTRDNFNDIYQYNEKIYNKAVQGKDGYIINRIVNVNCAVDKHYNLLKDTNYAINIHEDKYSESIDATSKLTTKQVAYNDITIGETRVGDDKANKTNALFVSSFNLNDSANQNKKYVDVGERAKAFYDSAYFEEKQLMNNQVMEEIGLLNESNMNFDFKKAGIVKKGKTCDFTFKVTDEYLQSYELEHGKKSLFDGDRVWLQISHGRISNVYVYKTEHLGGNITSDYEAYIFMITYLGKRVDVPVVPLESDNAPAYIRRDMFDGNVFEEGILSPLIG